MSLVQWIKEKDVINAYNLILNYNSVSVQSLQNYQYGFCQITRNEICNSNESSVLPPNFNEMIAYTPYYISSFELGRFYYPIILNNFQLGSTNYKTPLQLYMYYLQISFCDPPKYYVNVNYNYNDETSGNSYLLQLTFVHELIENIVPINYKWKLFSLIYNNYLTDDIINTIFDSLNNKNIKELIPEPLLFYFCNNYIYNFGFNFGLNGSFPSNNSIKINEFCKKE